MNFISKALSVLQMRTQKKKTKRKNLETSEFKESFGVNLCVNDIFKWTIKC